MNFWHLSCAHCAGVLEQNTFISFTPHKRAWAQTSKQWLGYSTGGWPSSFHAVVSLYLPLWAQGQLEIVSTLSKTSQGKLLFVCVASVYPRFYIQNMLVYIICVYARTLQLVIVYSGESALGQESIGGAQAWRRVGGLVWQVEKAANRVC